MFQKGKLIIRDILFVSKITQVNNKKRTIFAVGDEKQSIFSFQGALRAFF